MNDITQYSFLAYFIVGVMLAQVFTVQYIQTQLFVGVNTFWRFIAGNAIVFAILTVALQFKYLHLAVFAMFLFSGILF
jgi:hypothetical protein